MTVDERIQELISAYSLGVLEGEDLKALEEFKQNNPVQFEEMLRENEAEFARLSFAASLPDRPSSAVDQIAALQKENRTLKGRIEELTAQLQPKKAMPQRKPSTPAKTVKKTPAWRVVRFFIAFLLVRFRRDM